MKSGLIKVVAGLFWLILLMQACKSPEPATWGPLPQQPSAFVPVPVLPTTPPDSLKVLAFSLPGIPPENIQIDHKKREVRVTIPSDVSVHSFPASITMTLGYSALFTGSTTPYLFDLYSVRQPVQFYLQGDVYGTTSGKPYNIITLANGPLEITTPPASLSLETGSPLLITVKNYYDDAVLDNVAVLTNPLTGQQYTGTIQTCYEGLRSCQGATVGAVLAYFDANIAYGKYDLEIRKANQRQAHASGPLVVSKGLPSAGYSNLFDPPAPGTQNLRMDGCNLFEEDQIQLLLKNQTGERYILTPINYAADGRSLTVNLPSDMKSSQYAVQMVRKGQSVASFSRIIVSGNQLKPAFIYMSSIDPSQDPAVPVIIKRGNSQFFASTIVPGVAKIRLKLIPVGTTPQPVVLVDVDTPSIYWLAGPDGGSPSFSIPTTTPAGKYRIVLQYLMNDKQLVEGEPLERLIDLQ